MICEMAEDPDVEPKRLAVAGFSFGGGGMDSWITLGVNRTRLVIPKTTRTTRMMA